MEEPVVPGTPIIRVRIRVEKSRSVVARRRGARLLAGLLSLAIQVSLWIACATLVVGAVAHRELEYLPWLPIGVVPALLLVLWAGLLDRRDRGSRTPTREGTGRAGAVIGQLHTFSRTGEAGALVGGRGVEGWFTPGGLYLAAGEHLQWKRFSGLRITAESADLLKVTLADSGTPRARVLFITAWILLVLLIAAGPAIGVSISLRSLSLAGPRNDALALLASSLAMLQLCGLALDYLTREAKIPGSPRTVVALVDGTRFSREDLAQFFGEHL